MALQYLLAPTFQFVNTAGKPLSGGAYMEVYVHGTRTKYFCASDFDGTLHPFRIPLDSLGSNIVLANDTGSYDVYAYNRYGTLMMSRYNVKPGAGGGIGGTITSTDGSIDIHPTEDGVDLSVNGLDPSCLKVSADPRTTDGKFHFDTLVQEGDQAYVDNEGAIRLIKGWYHFTANVQLAWNAGARNETHQVTLYTTLSNSVIDFDISHVHTETIELSGDVSIAQDGAELVIGVSGMPTGLEASVIGMDVHAITGKDGHDKYYAGTGITISNENYISADFNEVQEKLVAGQGVTIDGNVISAPSLVQVNSDWNATSGVAEILNKPDLDVFATKTEVNAGLAGKQNTIPDLAAIRSGAQAGASAVQPADLAAVATTGNYNDLNNRPNLSVYATTADMNTALATKQDVISDLSTIRSGAAAGATAVQPSDLATVATTGAYSDLSGKPDLSIYAQSADLAAVATSGDYDDLSNKPDLSAYATTQAMNTALAGKQDTISDLSTIRSGAEAGATAVQPGDLATVATTGSYDDLSDKPSIPAAQVNSDWNSVSGVSQILNKPSLAAVATTGDYDDLSNKPSIPAAQVNADWNSVSGVSEILNKPANLVQDANYVHTDENFTSAEKTKLSGIAAGAEVNVQADWTESDSGSDAYIANKPALATVATTGAYSDLSGTPTIPTATSDLTNDSGYITLSDVPAQAQADWTESDTSDPSYIQNKPNLATVATTGAYSDLSGTPTINNVPAVTSSDNDKVLKASYSGGVGSYSWQTEQGGGSTYTAGDAIDITNDKIGVLYDSDTLELQSGSVTVHEDVDTFTGSVPQFNCGELPSEIAQVLGHISVTVHIPGDTFKTWYIGSDSAVLMFKRYNDDAPNSNYIAWCSTPLSVTQDTGTGQFVVDEQDVTVSTLTGPGASIALGYFCIGLVNGDIQNGNTLMPDNNSLTEPVEFEYTTGSGASSLAVKNPLPASAIGDATKVLTVDNTGAPVWATAQAPISAGTGIDITNNIVSVDTSVVATQTDLASKQDTISDLATIRSGAAEGATAVQPGDLATVATTGSYDDLADKPTIPAAQVNSDWNSSSGVSQILNKPQLSTVATTGDYDDLVNKPSIPAAQVNSDWNAVSGVSEILNKPVLATVATTGSYNDLSNTPSIPTATSDLTNDSGFITLSDVPAQSQADWTESDTSDPSYIQNKPNLATVATTGNYSDLSNTPTIPTVDQSYSASSTNAQSGTAVAQAVATKEDVFDVGTGLEMDTSGSTPTLQVEAPVDIVAGPGIVIDNPDGNTMRVSQAYPTDETVLWDGSTTGSDGNITLSESMTNFERIGIFFSIGSAYEQGTYWYGGKWQFFETGDLSITKKFCISDNMNNGDSANTLNFKNQSYAVSNDNLTFTLARSTQLYYNGSSWAVSTTAKSKIYKVVGIHRIASN